MSIPQWAQQHKRQGTEIKEIKGNYYLYERKSAWDPKRKKAKKVTGAYLGKVTPEGVVSPKKRVDAPILSIEYGASAFLYDLGQDILKVLKDELGEDDGKAVFATAALKTILACPFRRIGDRYVQSHISRLMPGLALSPASMTSLIDRIGASRTACARAMRRLSAPAPYVLVDGTRTISASEGMDRALPGHSKTHGFLPQLNQVYVLSASGDGFLPSFYRNVSGNIPDVTAFRLTVDDAGLDSACVVADAGFASDANFEMLNASGLDYIVPLKRNSTEVDLASVRLRTAFTYNDRAISASAIRKDGYDIHVFRDEALRAREISDFVARIEKANATAEKKRKFDPGSDLRDPGAEAAERQDQFGIIIIQTSLSGRSCAEIYTTYKLRWQIEQFFDTMRNSCSADTSYMHDDVGFEAWSFINHVMLLCACRILALLKDKGMSKDWSLSGVMDYLSRIHLVQVAGEWRVAETTDKTRKLLSSLGIMLEERQT